MRSWRTALRIAWREARRARGRTALTVALIATPVLWLSFAVMTVDLFRLSPAQAATRAMGQADVTLSATAPMTVDAVAELLPAGSHVAVQETTRVTLHSAGRTRLLDGLALDLTDPVNNGLAEVLTGTAATTGDQILINEKARDTYGLTVGDQLSVGDDADRGVRTYTVAGVVDRPQNIWAELLFRPAQLPGAGGKFTTFGVDTAGDLDDSRLAGLNDAGMQVTQRGDQFDRSAGLNAAGAGIGGLILFEVVLLAVPAFAVGARRRQRELGLIAATGGTPAQLRRVVLADGVLAGAAAAVTGLIGGIVLAFAAAPLAEQHIFQYAPGGFTGVPVELLAVTATAVAAGMLAALMPALAAARQSVVAALGARRGETRSPRRWWLLGAGLLTAGVAGAFGAAWYGNRPAVFAGIALAEAGFVLCTPALIGVLARAGGVMPLSLRIALRDLGRNRASGAPAVAAIMATVAGTVAMGVFTVNDGLRLREAYLPSLPAGYATVTMQSSRPEALDAVRAAVTDMLPTTTVATYGTIVCPDGKPATPGSGTCGLSLAWDEDAACPIGTSAATLTRAAVDAALRDPRCSTESHANGYAVEPMVVDDGTAIAALFGADRAGVERATAVLRRGGVVVTKPYLVHDDTVTLSLDTVSSSCGALCSNLDSELVTVPAYAITTDTTYFESFVSPAVVRKLKLGVRDTGLIAATSRTPTEAEANAVKATVSGLGAGYTLVERGSNEQPDRYLYLLLGVAAALTLTATAVSTALAAADSRPTLTTLATVGAPPHVRRMLSLSQAGATAGLGTLLGIGSGVALSTAAMLAQNNAARPVWPPSLPYPVDVPWTMVALVLVVPLVAMAGAGLLTRSRLPIEHR
ncbi:FtsX-like permease family protein [Actinoplanes sp. NPDC051494]|uniref:FtsX-like permease family protein n=1 Tax=Actinoplanes sp. NPDC051494 TaxID=3363907 RepID=UPI0037884EA2